MSRPDNYHLKAKCNEACQYAEDLSDAAGVPYADRNGNRRNVYEPRDFFAIVMKQLRARHNLEFM